MRPFRSITTILAFSLLCAITQDAFAASLNEIPDFVSRVMEQLRSVGGQSNSCNLHPQKFSSSDEFISYVCQIDSLNEAALSEIKSRGGEALIKSLTDGQMDLEGFKKNFDFFTNNNSSISKDYRTEDKNNWNDEISKVTTCNYASQEKGKFVQEAKFSSFSFLGVRHQYDVPGNQKADYQKNIKDRLDLKAVDAIVIEGTEFGMPLDCLQTLKTVFTPTENLSSESEFLTKYGFTNRKALIPGDNQIIDQEDIKIFFKNDEEKALQTKRDIEAIDLLQFYYQELLKGGKTPLETALEKLKHWNGSSNYDLNSFSDFYKKVNKRDLPTNPNEIKDDITPSAFSKNPRGTNTFVDIQSDLRNKALMRAIEISKKKFKSTAAVFGMGHLELLGPTLEKHLGKPTLDYKVVCP